MTYADLHIHTTHSDGTLSPEEVVAEALRNGVGLLAVADHETTSGSRAVIPLCEKAGLTCVPACELSAMHERTYLHILAYGVDFDADLFASLVLGNRLTLDSMSEDLIALLSRDDPRVSLSDYMSYERDVSRGGWKGIDYLYARGVTPFPMAGAALYGQYGVTYEAAGFPAFRDVADAICAAGGKAVLAHPGLVRTDDLASLIYSLADDGLNGAECYYPQHAPETVQACLSLCDALGLLVTAGSDCHGAFGKARVGETNTPVRCLRLGDLFPKSLEQG